MQRNERDGVWMHLECGRSLEEETLRVSYGHLFLIRRQEGLWHATHVTL